jgi:hypothetical protein
MSAWVVKEGAGHSTYYRVLRGFEIPSQKIATLAERMRSKYGGWGCPSKLLKERHHPKC